MKKTRTSAAAVLALTGVLALAACSPPHENGSENKVDTATTGAPSPSIATTKSADSHSGHSHGDTKTTGSASTAMDADLSESAIATLTVSGSSSSTLHNDLKTQGTAGTTKTGSEPTPVAAH